MSISGKVPLVSVCLPTYHGARYLSQCLRSVLDQDLSDFELIIVDDSSSDSTLFIAESFRDSRVSVYENESRVGLAGNWNQALRLARAPYVTVFHQDDVMAVNNLSAKVELMESDPSVALVHSAAEMLVEVDDAPDYAAPVNHYDADFQASGLDFFLTLVLEGNRVIAPSALVRRDLVLSAGCFDEALKFTPDYEMWMRLCAFGATAYLSVPLISYRWHSGNTTHEFRFDDGVEEIATACRSAITFWGRHAPKAIDEALLLRSVGALDEARRWASHAERDRAALLQRNAELMTVVQERDILLDRVDWLRGAFRWYEAEAQMLRRIADDGRLRGQTPASPVLDRLGGDVSERLRSVCRRLRRKRA